MLTSKQIAEFAELFKVEDESIWTIGDLLVKYELTWDDIERLANEVDRSAVTLRRRKILAQAFPADQWNREGCGIGVFEHLFRLDDVEDRKKLFKRRKAWTVNAMRLEVDKIIDGLMTPDGKVESIQPPPLPIPPPMAPPTTVKVTRHKWADTEFALKSTLTDKGILTFTLPAPLNGEIVTVVDEETGNVVVTVPLSVEALESGECAAAPI